MLSKKTLLASALLALGGVAVSASAATAQAPTNFLVKLKIDAACTVSTSGALDFSNAASNSTSDLTANAATISVTCSNATGYNVGLTPQSTTATTGTGTLKGTGGNTDTVAYALYQDSANTTAWGNVVNTNTKTGTGTGSAQSLTVYGKVLGSNLNVTPDAYSDTVAVVVTY